MSNEERFQFCMMVAREIVARRRAEAPEGCDPKNTWVAVGVGVAGLATSFIASSNASDNANQIFGTKPKVAPFIPVDLSVEQGKATASNLANYPNIQALIDKMIPGFSDAESAGVANAASEIKGQIPDDVAAQVQRSAAFKELQGGFDTGGGTPNQAGLTIAPRDLGLTSLGLQQQGQNSLQLWSSIAQQLSQPYLITTQDETNIAQSNNAGQQATAQAQDNVNAAPNPAAAGLFNFQTAQNQQNQNNLLGLALLLSKNGGFSNLGGATSGANGSSVGGWNIDPNGNLIGFT